MDRSTFPPEIASFVDALLRHEFAVVENRHDHDRFGDHIVVLARRHMRVRLVRDRGSWFIEVGRAGGEWFAPVVWHAFLSDAMPPLEIPGLAADAEFVLDNLEEIGRATDAEADSLDGVLSDWRWQRAAARRSISPFQ